MFNYQKYPKDWRDRRIIELEKEIDDLRAQNSTLVDQLVSSVAASDSMKLQLILSGALTIPKEKQV